MYNSLVGVAAVVAMRLFPSQCGGGDDLPKSVANPRLQITSKFSGLRRPPNRGGARHVLTLAQDRSLHLERFENNTIGFRLLQPQNRKSPSLPRLGRYAMKKNNGQAEAFLSYS